MFSEYNDSKVWHTWCLEKTCVHKVLCRNAEMAELGDAADSKSVPLFS